VRLYPAHPGNPRTLIEGESPLKGRTYGLGRFILYELEKLVWARPYLERALARGVADALEVLCDLAVIGLFVPPKR